VSRLLGLAFGGADGSFVWQEPEDIVAAELGPGEKLLWAGRPPRGLLLRPSDLHQIPFSIMWGGFAIFWEASVVVMGAPFFFALWGVPFVLVGLYIMAGRFRVDAWQRERTFYGVTSERAIILSVAFGRSVKSLNLDTLTDMTLTERSDGRGTITFGPCPPWGGWHSSGWPGSGRQSALGFEMPSEARQVYEVILNAQRTLRRRP
jgi:hypothetical protein